MYRKESAFTLIETLIALAVFAFVLFLIYFALQFFQNEKKTANLISYQRALMQLESPERQYEWVAEKNRIYFVSDRRGNQKMRFRLSKNTLQLTTDQGGTMPIVAGVTHFELQEVNHRLHFSLFFSGKEHYETDLLLKKRASKAD